MKWIKYQVVQSAIGESIVLIDKKIGYSDENLVIAQTEAHNGYEIIEDGETFDKEPIAVDHGGTGAMTAAGARANLGAVAMKAITIYLPADGWSDKWQNVNADGVTADNVVIVTAAPESYEHYNECAVRCGAQSMGVLSFVCTDVPTSNLTANVLILE